MTLSIGAPAYSPLVKVRIANTSDEVMTIDRLITSGGGLRVDFTEEDIPLGEKGLPYTIEPYSIVEGWSLSG